jgi:uncharacterized OB-fold protein
MAVCPNCNYEYVEGVTICPDCGSALIDPKFIEKPEEWTEKNWEVVYTSNKEYEVEMIKNNLDGAGIISEILVQKDRNFPAPGDLGLVKLLVMKEDVQAALNYIERIMKESSEEDES